MDRVTKTLRGQSVQPILRRRRTACHRTERLPRRGLADTHGLYILGGCAFIFLILIVYWMWPRGERLAEVRGVVTFQGKPVPKEARVAFLNSETGRFIAAELDDNGEYRVGVADGWGLPPGSYQVAVLAPDWPPEFPEVPRKYRDPDKSGLVLDLSDDGAEFNIELVPDPTEIIRDQGGASSRKAQRRR